VVIHPLNRCCFRLAQRAIFWQKDFMVSHEDPRDGAPEFGHNPFAALNSAGLPPGPQGPSTKAPTKNRGRVDIIRQKAGRGGKTVTVVAHFVGIGLPEKEKLAKQMQKICGTGGTVKDGQIEIQGDKREEIARILIEAGFRPVFAGG
jgi:translation initiation factor 1